MERIKNYVIGILLAHLSIPIVIFAMHFYGSQPVEAESVFKAVVIMSGAGFALSLPVGIALGVPVSYLLSKYNLLNLFTIFALALSVPLILGIYVSTFGLFYFGLPFAVLGAVIYWCYLKSTKTLKSV